jgi:hypothetical protein
MKPDSPYDWRIEAAVMEFATAILHGDEKHRAWLIAAARDFLDGKPIRAQKDH